MVMYGGLAMESGASADIIGNPGHPYTKALLASSPQFGSHYSRGKLPVIPGKAADLCVSGCPFAPRCTQAQSACFSEIPPLSETNGRALRCVLRA